MIGKAADGSRAISFHGGLMSMVVCVASK